MGKLEELSRQISQKLIQSGFEKEADELSEIVSKLYTETDQKQRKELVQDIVDRTNVRWYGDLNIQNLDYRDWWKLLEKLRKEAFKEKQ